jgi:1-acyl-sn-glycerol-3-phosphate acyltransferase
MTKQFRHDDQSTDSFKKVDPHIIIHGRRLNRLILLLAHLIIGFFVVSSLSIMQRLGYYAAWHSRSICWWYRRVCCILALQLHIQGHYQPHALLVANHISWLDVPVLGSQGTIGFLAKAEVRTWPIIGRMAVAVKTVFIMRGGHHIQSVIEAIRDRLRHGMAVVIFPEGTTTDGQTLKPFHSRLFAAVQPLAVPTSPQQHQPPPLPYHMVQPVALRYGTLTHPDLEAPFINDDQLLMHTWRLLRRPYITVHVRFFEPIQVIEQSRRELAQASRTAIMDYLQQPTELS